MKNFLSWEDGEVILQPGLNLITGVLGSGKSAIFQAIRFALGSQKKDERYSAWHHFIKSGENSSEVTVEIKRASTDDLTVIKRVIVREKTASKYFFNSKRSTATEIQNFIRNLGFNVDSPFCFVPQGNVTALQKLDPIALRIWFEDGLGLRTVRQKIALTKERIEQLTQEIKQRQVIIRNLEEMYAECKRNFIQFQEKKELEKRIEKLLIEKTYLKLIQTDRDIAEIRNEIESKTQETVLLSRRLAEEDQKRHELIDKRKELKIRRFSVEQELLDNVEELGSLKTLINELEKESSWTIQELLKCQNNLKATENNLKKVNQVTKKSQLNLQHLKNQEEVLQSDIENAEQRLEDLSLEEDRFREWQDEKKQLERRISEIIFNENQKNSQRQEYERKRQNFQLDLKDVETSLNQFDWNENLTKESLEKRQISLQDQMYRASGQIGTLELNKKKISDDYENVQRQVIEANRLFSASNQAFYDEIKKRNLEERIVGPIIQLIKLNEESKQVLASIFGERLFSGFIVYNETDLLLAYELARKFSAEIQIIQIDISSLDDDSFSNLSETLGFLFDEIETINDSFLRGLAVIIQNWTIASSFPEGYRQLARNKKIVLRDNASTLFKGNFVEIRTHTKEKRTIPSLVSLQDNLLTLQNELSEIETELERQYFLQSQATLEVSKLESQLSFLPAVQRLMERKSSIISRNRELWDNLQTLIVEIDDLNRKHEETKNELEETKIRKPRQLEEIHETVDRLKTLLKQKKILYKKVTQDITDQISLEIKKQGEISQMKARVEDLNRQISDLVEKTSKFTEHESKLHTKFENARKTKKELEDEVINIEEEQDQIQGEIENFYEIQGETSKLIEKYKLEVAQHEKKSHDLNEVKSKLILELRNSTVERPSRARIISEIENDIRTSQNRLLQYAKIPSDLPEKINELSEEIKTERKVIAPVVQSLSIAKRDFKLFKENYADNFDQKITELNKQINHVLEKDVGKVIIELEKEFSPTQRIEITTTFRGTKPRQISSLSGGEKSLVTLGIIVGLQAMNVSSCYAYDELEMHLDAEHLDKTGQIFNQAASRTQILIITPDRSSVGINRFAHHIIGITRLGRNGPSVSTIFPIISEIVED